VICIILLRLVLSPRSGHCSNSAMKGRWPKALKKVFLLVVPELLQFLCFHCVVHSPHPPKRGNCPSVTVPPPPHGGGTVTISGGGFQGKVKVQLAVLASSIIVHSILQILFFSGVPGFGVHHACRGHEKLYVWRNVGLRTQEHPHS